MNPSKFPRMPSIGKKYYSENNTAKAKMKGVNEENEKSKIFVCNTCEKNFYKKSSLIEHLSTHNLISNSSASEEDIPFENKEDSNICRICHKRFTVKKNLLRHLRQIHKNFNEAEKMIVKKLKCPERNCDFTCRMMKKLRNHIEEVHKVKILKDILQFQSDTVFQKWKKDEETNTMSLFVSGRKKTSLMCGGKKQILSCHRTGQYNPKGFGKYRMRSAGSCKIGVTCPAAMEVTETPDGQLNVTYYKTHLGHSQDVVYLKLSQEDRTQLAEKIKQGFSLDAILEDVKEDNHFKSDLTKRIHLLSKKDLYRIMRAANDNRKKSKENIKEKSEELSSTQSKDIEVTQGPSNEKNISKDSANEPKELVTSQELVLGNSEMQKLGRDCHPNFTLFPSQRTVLPQEFRGREADSPMRLIDLNNPQVSGEGIAPQIVILSPEVDYTPVAEIILLPPQEAVPQSVVTAQKMLTEEDTAKRPQEPPHSVDKTDEKNEMGKPNLGSKLKEKIDKIMEFLPKSEFLTPKQFDLINAKLDGILNIFNIMNMKGKNRRSQFKKKVAQKSPEALEKIHEAKMSVQVDAPFLAQPMYESPFIYAVYN